MSTPATLQDLLPKWAHFCLYVERFIIHELEFDLTRKHIVAAVSGGVDSTALLHVLGFLAPRNDLTLTAVHLNHQLRPEAKGDMEHVQGLCKSMGVDCITETKDVAQLATDTGVGVEEAGRNARYALYSEVLAQTGAEAVALGHHLDDLSEDVLMRFIRGTGWPGLAGMPGHDSNRKLLRPFLSLPKSTLSAFVERLGVSWREDESNAELDGMRNRIRHELLPLIFQENPNFADSVARLWKIGRIEADYWSDRIGDPASTIDDEALRSRHQAERLRMYKAALDALGPGQALAHTLFKLDESWRDGRIGAVFQFPGEKTASIVQGGVVFSASH